MNNPYASPAQTAPYGSGSSEPYRADDRAEVSQTSVEMLRQTKPWVTLLSVISFLGAGFMLLGGISMMAMGAIAPAGASPIPMAAMGAVYIPFALLYVYPALKLWGYSSAIGRLVASRSTIDLDAALSQQKSFWKFAGISTIVMIVLYGVFIVGFMIVGVAALGGARH